MTTPDTPAGRGVSALAAALADLAADAVEGCTLERVILYGLYTDGRSGYAGTARRTITPDELRAVLDENQRLTRETERLRAWVCACQDDYLSPRCMVHGDPQQPKLSMREMARWQSTFEELHARILRDLPSDVSGLPQPEDAFWAESLDALVQFSTQLYERTWMQRLRPGTVPSGTDNERR
jgi:hypothetical protein